MKFSKIKSNIMFYLFKALIFIGLIMPISAQSSSEVIRKIMDAVEERHDAAEASIEAEYNLMNDYHRLAMESPDVFYYSTSEGSGLYAPLVGFRKEFLDLMKKPKFEFDIVKNDFDEPFPAASYFYEILPNNPEKTASNRASALAEQERDIKSATKALDDAVKAAHKSQYTDEPTSLPYDEGSQPCYDPLKRIETMRSHLVTSRKEWMENGTYAGDVDLHKRNYIYNPGSYRDAKKHNQLFKLKHYEDWQKSRDKEVAYKMRNLDRFTRSSVTGHVISKDSDSVTVYREWQESKAELWADYNKRRNDWYEEQRKLAADEYYAKAVAFAGRMTSFYNSERFIRAVNKYQYINGLNYSIINCNVGVPFQKAVIKWIYENPLGFEQEIVTLNEISKHLDRISGAYIHKDAESIGVVNRDNYTVKLSQIIVRLNSLDTLEWPMLARQYKTPLSSRDLPSVGTSTVNLSEIDGHSYRLDYFTEKSFLHHNTLVGKPQLVKSVGWRKDMATHLSAFRGGTHIYGNGYVNDISSIKGGLEGTMYLTYDTENTNLFELGSSILAEPDVAGMTEFAAKPVEIDGNLLNLSYLIESNAPDYRSGNVEPPSEDRLRHAKHVLSYLTTKATRNYSSESALLKLPKEINIDVKVSGDSESSTREVKRVNKLREFLPSDQINMNEYPLSNKVLYGGHTMLFKPDFKVLIDMPEKFVAPVSYNLKINELLAKKDFGMSLPLPTSQENKGTQPFLTLPIFNLIYEDLKYAGNLGLGGAMKIIGDVSHLDIKTKEPLKIKKYLWQQLSDDVSEDFLPHNIISSSITGGLLNNLDGRIMSEIIGDTGKVKIEWINHYACIIKCYLSGNDIPVSTYEIKIENIDEGTVVAKIIDNYTFKYPEGFETITINKDGKLWATMSIISEDTALKPENQEFCKIAYYDGLDTSKVVETHYYSTRYDATLSRNLLVKQIKHASEDKLEQSFVIEDKAYSPGYFYSLPNVLNTSRQQRSIDYEFYSNSRVYSDFNSQGAYNPFESYIYAGGDKNFYKQSFLDESDGGEWTHLPFIRHVRKMTLSGADWGNDGETFEFEHDGTLKEHRYKVAGFAAVDKVESIENGFVYKSEVDGKLMSERKVTYPEGLSKVVTEVDGVSSTVEYYTSKLNGGLPWFVKSIVNDLGDTTYTYDAKTNGALTVTETYKAKGGDSDIVTTTELNQYGSTTSRIVKSGSAVISSFRADGHETNAFRQPTSITATQGGVTKSQQYTYHRDGSVATTTSSDGVINEYEWDILGRIKAGTKLDGKELTPQYNGFTNSVDFAGSKVTSKVDSYGRVTESQTEVGEGKYKLTSRYKSSSSTSSTSTVESQQGDRSAGSTRLLSGLPSRVDGGFGSPGVDFSYGVEDYKGTPCYTVKSTVLDEDGGLSGVWQKTYTDGYGRKLKVETPSPDGSKTVETTFEYDMRARKITVTRPPPSKPIVMSYSADWNTLTYEHAGVSYSNKKELINGVLTDKSFKNTRELSSIVSDLGSSITKFRTNGKNEVISRVSGDGNTFTVEDSEGGAHTSVYDKDGLASTETRIAGETYSSRVVKRDANTGAVIEAESISPVSGKTVSKFASTGQLIEVSGDGVKSKFDVKYVNGGEVFEVTDEKTGTFATSASNKFGSIKSAATTGRPEKVFEGSATSLNNSFGVKGKPNQVVNYGYSSSGYLESLFRKDGSGTTYKYHDNGELKSYTNHDIPSIPGLAGTGGQYSFRLDRDSVTGYPAGYTAVRGQTQVEAKLEIKYDQFRNLKSCSYQSTDIDGRNVDYSCVFSEYIYDQPTKVSHQGVLNGYKVQRFYNDKDELRRVELRSGLALIHAINYDTDAKGRISAISSSARSRFNTVFGYDKGKVVRLDQGNVKTTRKYSTAGGKKGLMESVTTQAGPATYSATWGIDGKQRRASQTIVRPDAPARQWSYGYDVNHQLQSASTGNGAADYRFNYAHDLMGNRAVARANDANQYRVIHVPGSKKYTVSGRVRPGTLVAVTGAQGADAELTEKVPVVDAAGYFSAVFDAPATNLDPANLDVKVIGTIRGAGDPVLPGDVGGARRDAKARKDTVITLRPVQWDLQYGAHAALASDWRWDYYWNIEGKLIGMQTKAAALADGTPNLRIKFSYDGQGRRIQKITEYMQPNGVKLKTVTRKFVYDGWNLIGEFTDDSVTGKSRRFYTWAPNIGGINGLLSIHEDGETYLPVYDGNANIIALTDTAGQQVARWERGPFGELLNHSGRVHLCPFGFATQYTDSESGLVYFGHRHYDPLTGRWLSREPLGEQESFNLYAYCHNDPVHKVDLLGLAEITKEQYDYTISYFKLDQIAHSPRRVVWALAQRAWDPDFKDSDLKSAIRPQYRDRFIKALRNMEDQGTDLNKNLRKVLPKPKYSIAEIIAERALTPEERYRRKKISEGYTPIPGINAFLDPPHIMRSKSGAMAASLGDSVLNGGYQTVKFAVNVVEYTSPAPVATKFILGNSFSLSDRMQGDLRPFKQFANQEYYDTVQPWTDMTTGIATAFLPSMWAGKADKVLDTFKLTDDFVVQGKRIGTNNVDDIALGLTRDKNGNQLLQPFADDLGAIGNKDWIAKGLSGEKPFVQRFYQALYRSTSGGGRIKFNLDDLDINRALKTDRFSDPFDVGVTNWELQQILSNRQFYDATDFFLGGQKLDLQDVIDFGLGSKNK